MRSLARWGAQIAVRCGFRANRLATGVRGRSCCTGGKVGHGPFALALVLPWRGHGTCRTGENQVRGEDYGPDMPARHKSAPYRRAQTAADR